MEIFLYGIDHFDIRKGKGQVVEKKDLAQAHLYIIEILEVGDPYSLFDLYNDRTRPYFKDEDTFTNYVYNYCKENFGVDIEETSIQSAYRVLDLTDLLFIVGKPGVELEKKYNFDFLNRLEPYQKYSFMVGLDITKRIIKIVDAYNNQLNLENELLNNVLDREYDKEFWKERYKHGNKINFLRSLLWSYMQVAGISKEEVTPSLIAEILSDEFPFTTRYDGDGKIYINPYTFSKVVQEVKNYMNKERHGKVGIIVGRPHLKFLLHFMEKKYPSSIFHSIDLTENKELFQEVDENDIPIYIRLAEEHHLLD